MVKTAAQAGASLIVLPEMFYYPFDVAALPTICGGEADILTGFSDLARNLNVHICTGSMAVRDGDALYNRSYLLDSSGKQVISYDKSHLFDVGLRGIKVQESQTFTRGNRVCIAETELGKIGLLICYDIRFPEWSRKLALGGVEVLLVPAVFNQVTGPAHWHIMMRARAIENQVYLAAVSQGRNKDAAYKAYGHSLVVSPWGELLTEAHEQEQIVYADLDSEMIVETRNRLPLLRHRRNDLY